MTNSRENLSRPGIIDARARYRAAARQLRNTGVDNPPCADCWDITVHAETLDGSKYGRRYRL